ncbi:MAG TPA: trypsin-like peptidase domain-containing protein [Bryobacteraceae bacterium]|jgi:serine protease Do|nr:trypsin-like peptidase domain-containing protein [Bryobacteraceae bacterium]
MPIPVPGRVAEALRKQTVHIQVGGRRGQSTGSGVIIGPERVITNGHVIRGRSLHIEAWDGRDVSASCLKLDAHRDLALLSAPGLRAEPACLRDSDGLRAGTAVFAVGNPLGFVGAVSSGIVHAVGSFGGLAWIQADLRLAPGNSGGPLADFHGQVLGINTMVMSGGLALAVPSRAVQSFLLRAQTGRSLGVTVRPVQLEAGRLGILILEISAGAAAVTASLLPGDILAGAEGRAFQSLDDLQFAIDTAPQAVLHLDFYRGGQRNLRHVAVRLTPEQVPTAA